MREIITLQLGQRSNYLATHFWNTQESYFTYSESEQSIIDHNVHFRPGLGVDGTETFTPRTIIYDLKGGFGSLRKFNALYQIENDSSPIRGLWDGETSTLKNPAIDPSEYQKNLDLGLPTSQLRSSDIRYWSDFNRVFYHPKSIVQLNDYELNSQLAPFEKWSSGEELFQSIDKEFDVIDRDVRPFAEECDQLQGLQVFTGADDAWGGFSSEYIESLRDEFGKTAIWVWGIEDGAHVARHKQIARAANSARSLRAVGQQAVTYLRMAAPPTALPGYVNLDVPVDWMTTALICSALESSTISSRMHSNSTNTGSLSLLEDTLNTNGRQNLFELQASIKSRDAPLESISVSKPDHRSPPDSSEGEPGTEPASYDISYSPSLIQASRTRRRNTHVFAQVESYREDTENPARATTLSLDERQRRRLNEESVVEIFRTDLLFPLLDTFPDQLFQIRGREKGLQISAALVCNSGMKEKVLDLRDGVFRAFPLDEREGLYNDLTQLAGNYDCGWDSGSDTGDDDD